MRYRIESGNKAIIKWTIKDDGFVLSKFVFSLEGDILTVEASSRTRNKKNRPNKLKVEIRDFQRKTAVEVFAEHRNFGRPYYDGVLQVWKDLHLPLGFVTPILKEM